MIVPDNLIISCVEITHRALGHPGFHRMWNTIRKSYFWKSMQKDVRTYCSTCHYCRSRKSSSEQGSIPIQGYYISERPWQRCHIDCMVGLPISDEGQYTAVLILKCALSKFVCLEPLKDVTAQSISEALVNIFTTHGVPEFIISDNGVEFANYLTTDVLKLLGARKFHITPINPRANGQAENQVKTVKDTLSLLIKKDQRDWSMFIRLVQMRYNSTVNQATGFSPYFLMNGREMPIPDHEHIQSTYDKNKNVEIEGYFGKLVIAMMLIWEAAGEEILQKTQHYNKLIGTNIENNIKQYEIGQYVFLRRIPRRFYKDHQENVKYHINLKLQPVRWTGPYRIIQKLSPVLYVLDFHNTQKKIHITHLKLASNLSINRRKLEICRQSERSQDKPVIKEPVISTTVDEIWSDHHNDHI
jgi:transposase InsO family protein